MLQHLVKTLRKYERAKELQDVYRVDPNYFNFNERPLLIIDDLVTTGATIGALIRAIIKHFPRANISVLTMAWTPAPAQQEYLRQMPEIGAVLREPAVVYGRTNSPWDDDEFLDGDTDLSVFAHRPR